MKWIFLILCFLPLCYACSDRKETNELRVYVAASLAPVISDIGQAFQTENDVPVIINAASSGTLARQIEQGAPSDIFISANEKWTQYLASKKLLNKTTQLPISNRLVLITPIGNHQKPIAPPSDLIISDYLKRGKIAIGDPKHVPAGAYAMDAINALDWEISSNQILQTKDARATLVAVELGEVALGIVYQSDAQKSSKIKTLSTISTSAHRKITYYMGTSSNSPMALEFMNFLNSPSVAPLWGQHGFDSLPH